MGREDREASRGAVRDRPGLALHCGIQEPDGGESRGGEGALASPFWVLGGLHVDRQGLSTLPC